MATRVKRFGPNVTGGRDLVVGDVHGHYTRLMKTLELAEFDPQKDRLFSVGDLVDRGPESRECLEMPIHAVRGNHEDMMEGFAYGLYPAQWYYENGGAWMIGKTQPERIEMADLVEDMPYVIEVETRHGRVGIIHADTIGNDWDVTVKAFETTMDAKELRKLKLHCLWSLRRVDHQDRTPVKGVEAVVVGHYVQPAPLVLGNTYHIDTGGWTRTGYFTLFDLDTLKPLPLAKPALQW